MGNMIRVVQLLLGVMPFVVELVKAIEIPGNGAQKLETVVSIVNAAVEALPQDIKNLIGGSTLTAFLTAAVGAIVKLFNLVGVFKK